jgi:hypothetical protein
VLLLLHLVQAQQQVAHPLLQLLLQQYQHPTLHQCQQQQLTLPLTLAGTVARHLLLLLELLLHCWQQAVRQLQQHLLLQLVHALQLQHRSQQQLHLPLQALLPLPQLLLWLLAPVAAAAVGAVCSAAEQAVPAARC